MSFQRKRVNHRKLQISRRDFRISFNLEALWISSCCSLRTIPEFPSRLSDIEFEDCGNLRNFPSTSGLPSLKYLFITNCGSLTEIGNLTSRRIYVRISKCEFLSDVRRNAGPAFYDADMEACLSPISMGSNSSGSP